MTRWPYNLLPKSRQLSEQRGVLILAQAIQSSLMVNYVWENKALGRNYLCCYLPNTGQARSTYTWNSTNINGAGAEREGESRKMRQEWSGTWIPSTCEEVPFGVFIWVSDEIRFIFSKICLAAVWRMNRSRKGSIRQSRLSKWERITTWTNGGDCKGGRKKGTVLGQLI